MREQELLDLETLFEKYIGWQLRILNPNDEGTYLQGPIINLIASKDDDGFVLLGFPLHWVATATGQDVHWKLYRDSTGNFIRGLTIRSSLESLRTFAKKGDFVFVEQDVITILVPPGHKLWIERPEK